MNDVFIKINMDNKLKMIKYSRSIGIVGGVGPYAGIELARKILLATKASSDQEHIPILLHSRPNLIMDRTSFLMDRSLENPGLILGEIMRELAMNGAVVIGMPCNTAHSPAILDTALSKIEDIKEKTFFVNMILSVVEYISQYRHINKVGILSTIGTYQAKIYQDAFIKKGITTIFPCEKGRRFVQQAISNRKFGIKAVCCPPTAQAKNILLEQARLLIQKGSRIILLGCTEIPLALTEDSLDSVPFIDPAEILAEKLISVFDPEKILKKERSI